MKTTKRILAVVLAVFLMAALVVVPASATSAQTTTDKTGSIELLNAMAGVTYDLYRVFDMRSTDGTNHSFTLNAEFTKAYQAGAFKDLFKLSDSGTVEPLNTLVDHTLEAWAQAVADAVVLAVSDPATYSNDGVTPIKAVGQLIPTTSGKSNSYDHEFGYYVMVSSRGSARTVFTISSTGTISITEKNGGLPTLSQTVETAKNANPTNTSVTADSATVLWNMVAVTAKAGTDTYTINVSVPAGLTILDDPSVKLWLGKGVTQVAVTPTVDHENGTITVTVPDSTRLNLKDGDILSLTFCTQLNGSAELDTTANTINSTLVYGEPDATTGEYPHEDDDTSVWTSGITFHKHIGDTDEHLAGAGFKLSNGSQYAVLTELENKVYLFAGWSSDGTEITTPADTHATNVKIIGLKEGTYILKETTTPDGYVKAADATVTITADSATNTTRITGVYDLIIRNYYGTTLPSTGGMGTTLFYTAGAVLVLAAVVLLITKKRVAR